MKQIALIQNEEKPISVEIVARMSFDPELNN